MTFGALWAEPTVSPQRCYGGSDSFRRGGAALPRGPLRRSRRVRAPRPTGSDSLTCAFSGRKTVSPVQSRERPLPRRVTGTALVQRSHGALGRPFPHRSPYGSGRRVTAPPSAGRRAHEPVPRGGPAARVRGGSANPGLGRPTPSPQSHSASSPRRTALARAGRRGRPKSREPTRGRAGAPHPGSPEAASRPHRPREDPGASATDEAPGAGPAEGDRGPRGRSSRARSLRGAGRPSPPGASAGQRR